MAFVAVKVERLDHYRETFYKILHKNTAYIEMDLIILMLVSDITHL